MKSKAGMKGKIPKIVWHIAIGIYVDHKNKPHWDPMRAFNTAIVQCWRYGILKKGTLELTEYGKKLQQKNHPKYEKAKMSVKRFKELLIRSISI